MDAGGPATDVSRLARFTSSSSAAGVFAVSVTPAPGKVAEATRLVAAGETEHTLPTPQAIPPTVSVPLESLRNVSIGFATVTETPVYVPGFTRTALAVNSEISVCRRVTSTVTGALSTETLPGFSVTLVSVMRNDSTLTPAGAASLMARLTRASLPVLPPKLPNPAPEPQPARPRLRAVANAIHAAWLRLIVLRRSSAVSLLPKRWHTVGCRKGNF